MEQRDGKSRSGPGNQRNSHPNNETEPINMQAEGALKIVGKDLSVTQARMIEREMQLLGYRAATERMNAEAAKKQAENTTDKIIKDYERSGQRLA